MTNHGDVNGDLTHDSNFSFFYGLLLFLKARPFLVVNFLGIPLFNETN